MIAPVASLASRPERAARLFHALSDGTRLAVLDLLRGGDKCVCDLQEAVGAAQSRLSFHLKVLREAGLVTDRREGRWSYYALNRETMGAAEGFLAAMAAAPAAGTTSARLVQLGRGRAAPRRRTAASAVTAGARDGCCG